MESFSALLAICARNSPVTGEFRRQWPVTRSFDVFFDLRLNKRLSKQWRRWWFETSLHSLWRQRSDESWGASFLSYMSDLCSIYSVMLKRGPYPLKPSQKTPHISPSRASLLWVQSLLYVLTLVAVIAVLYVLWWRHQMKTFSALLTICARNSPVTGEFPAESQRRGALMVFFYLRLNKLLSKKSPGWWFETPIMPSQ